MANLAGATKKDQRLWNTYLFWARVVLDPNTSSDARLEIAKPDRRLSATQDQALQAIVFAAFALEFRLKRIFEELGLSFRQRDTLGALLQNFRRRLEAAPRLDRKRQVSLPREWHSLEKRLTRLSSLRNQVAHANYTKVKQILSNRPRKVAARSFNALVDFIRVTNAAVGYDSDPPAKRRARYKPLRVDAR